MKTDIEMKARYSNLALLAPLAYVAFVLILLWGGMSLNRVIGMLSMFGGLSLMVVSLILREEMPRWLQVFHFTTGIPFLIWGVRLWLFVPPSWILPGIALGAVGALECSRRYVRMVRRARDREMIANQAAHAIVAATEAAKVTARLVTQAAEDVLMALRIREEQDGRRKEPKTD